MTASSVVVTVVAMITQYQKCVLKHYLGERTRHKNDRLSRAAMMQGVVRRDKWWSLQKNIVVLPEEGNWIDGHMPLPNSCTIAIATLRMSGSPLQYGCVASQNHMFCYAKLDMSAHWRPQ